MTSTTDTEQANPAPEKASRDVIDGVLGANAAAVAGLRTARPLVVEHTQGVYDALFDGPAAHSIGRERLIAVAVAVAELAGAAGLAAHYAGLGTVPAEGDPVLAAILRHAARVSTAPASLTRADIDTLSAAGLSETDVVTLAQVIGYVHFQVRLLAGLTLIGAAHE
ncbi:hypothetical protein [Nocardia jejuensis]|uniref:hypothetical protein n=1 Tax=Nocardia jejuensis TaxID=328049 RepID=UPI0009FC86A2|nr:hypothetical protein [Nocardia jejuensis]